MFRPPSLLLPLLALPFVGCHGGNSDQPSTLKILSRQPAQSSIVEVDTAVALVFAADPDPATLGPDALQVQDGSGPLPGSLAYDATTRTLTWTPSRELPRGAGLTASVASTVRGGAGQVVAANDAWSFRVRAGVAAAPVQIVGNLTNHDNRVFVGLHPDGAAQIAAGQQSWQWGSSGVGPAEFLSGGRVRDLHLDAAGRAVALTASGQGSGVSLYLTRRMTAGAAWSLPELIANTGFGVLLDARLLGNERGDLLMHAHTGWTSPTIVRDLVHWSAAAAPGSWLQLSVPFPNVWYGLLPALDGAGLVATLHAVNVTAGNQMLAQRQDPRLGTASIYTLAQDVYLRAEALAAAEDGTLRAVWLGPANVSQQSLAAPAAPFDLATDVPVFIQPASNWLAAATGALLGWKGSSAYRSEAGATAWSTATLPNDPLASAMSPRGEAVFVHFELPDSWSLVRWRAGEDIDPPVPLAIAASLFNAFRVASLAVDDVGRVVVVFQPQSPGELLGVRVE